MDGIAGADPLDVTFEIRHHNPRSGVYNPRVGIEAWIKYEPLIRQMHQAGFTRAQMLQALRTDCSFPVT